MDHYGRVDAASSSLYKGYRYPVEIISHCVWRPGKTRGGSTHRGSVFAVACSWLALNVLQFAVGGLARRHGTPKLSAAPRFFPVSRFSI
jgi:hypothetical protein